MWSRFSIIFSRLVKRRTSWLLTRSLVFTVRTPKFSGRGIKVESLPTLFRFSYLNPVPLGQSRDRHDERSTHGNRKMSQEDKKVQNADIFTTTTNSEYSNNTPNLLYYVHFVGYVPDRATTVNDSRIVPVTPLLLSLGWCPPRIPRRDG